MPSSLPNRERVAESTIVEPDTGDQAQQPLDYTSNS